MLSSVVQETEGSTDIRREECQRTAEGVCNVEYSLGAVKVHIEGQVIT